MTPIDKAIEENEKAEKIILNYPHELPMDIEMLLFHVQATQEALRGMQGQNLEALKREFREHVSQSDYIISAKLQFLSWGYKTIDQLAAHGYLNTSPAALSASTDTSGSLNQQDGLADEPERRAEYNPATHILIAREDVPDDLVEFVECIKEDNFPTESGLLKTQFINMFTDDLLKTAALIAEKTE